jgi:hypothetical protein
MARWLLIVGAVFAAIACASGDACAARAIDLGAPGALTDLELSNPAHYAKVLKILEGVVRQRDADVPRWMRTQFAATDVTYLPVILTSHPPKRHLSFSLDVTRYEILLTLTNVRGTIVPAQ